MTVVHHMHTARAHDIADKKEVASNPYVVLESIPALYADPPWQPPRQCAECEPRQLLDLVQDPLFPTLEPRAHVPATSRVLAQELWPNHFQSNFGFPHCVKAHQREVHSLQAEIAEQLHRARSNKEPAVPNTHRLRHPTR